MSTEVQVGPKIHPLDREMLPEDPLEMQAFEVPGDTELMFRIVIEEFARRSVLCRTARPMAAVWGRRVFAPHKSDSVAGRRRARADI